MIEWACCGVILQHIPYIFFCESCHFIELWIQRVIGADVESAGQVVQGDGADAGHEDALEHAFEFLEYFTVESAGMGQSYEQHPQSCGGNYK